MEARRKDYLQPFNEHVKFVNETYKTLMLPVEQADKITRDKVMAYQQEQSRIQREQEEINRLRMEAAQKDAALHHGEISESVNLVEVVDVQKKVSTDMGSLSTAKITKWEVIDFSLVPTDYKMIDSAKVGAVVRASKGNISIPGIRIWQEETLKVSTR
jgi:hypothetical protein